MAIKDEIENMKHKKEELNNLKNELSKFSKKIHKSTYKQLVKYENTLFSDETKKKVINVLEKNNYSIQKIVSKNENIIISYTDICEYEFKLQILLDKNNIIENIVIFHDIVLY